MTINIISVDFISCPVYFKGLELKKCTPHEKNEGQNSRANFWWCISKSQRKNFGLHWSILLFSMVTQLNFGLCWLNLLVKAISSFNPHQNKQRWTEVWTLENTILNTKEQTCETVQNASQEWPFYVHWGTAPWGYKESSRRVNVSQKSLILLQSANDNTLQEDVQTCWPARICQLWRTQGSVSRRRKRHPRAYSSVGRLWFSFGCNRFLVLIRLLLSVHSLEMALATNNFSNHGCFQIKCNLF